MLLLSAKNDSLDIIQDPPIEPKVPHFSDLNREEPSRLTEAVK